ncbi:MAG TPA: DUF6516 family protein [Candidatus Bathyarchaeia archaeon]|nr:DUF6516 family protein [Candidatus Bathyarchaeia archaeon]
MIREYFCEVEKKLEEIAWLIKKKNIEFNLVSEEMGIIKGKIVFVNSNVLGFRELVSAEHTDYRFQFMNGYNRLIYRWDSAPHHKEITPFPFHLHAPEGVRECEKVNLIEVKSLRLLRR